MFRSERVRQSILGLVGAAALSAALVSQGVAQNDGPEVSQEITPGGELAASVLDAEMETITYSNDPEVTTGTLQLTVNDPRGSGQGWNVTILSSNFDYQGTSPLGQDIPVTGFAITSVGTPSMSAGQPVDLAGGPMADGAAIATLDTPRRTIFANPGYGSGTYNQSIGVSLAIPAFSQTGTYVAELTVAIASAP